MTTSASIVINTHNRAASLKRTLQSLRYLDYPRFEVIVVNGPSTDNTDEVIEMWSDKIKAGNCTETNLSVSRNIGIAMASGDIIAFLDDDAIPEPEWLTRIVVGYDNKETGGVGGPTFNHTGHAYQARYIVCNRFGQARIENELNPTSYFNFPHALEFCALLGTNSSFRRDTLIEIGGFDEEYEYFLDETDVCVRMIDNGYMVKFVDDAFVHHKYLAGNIRNENRVLTNWYPVIKNSAYFSMKNAAHLYSMEELQKNVFGFIDEQRRSVSAAINQSLLEPDSLQAFEAEAAQAVKAGFKRGQDQPRRLITPETLMLNAQPFKQFPAFDGRDGGRLTICYLSGEYPPDFNGGIARFTHDLARGAASRGHNIHVITKGEGHDVIDWEDGVWIHRIVPREHEPDDIPADYHVCRSIHNYARTLHEEVKRIDLHHRVDIAEAPVWNSEGLELVLDDNFRPRTVVSLETPLKIVSENYASWTESPDIQCAIRTEETVLKNTLSFHAISRAIVASIRDDYGLEIPDSAIGMVPLGVPDRRDQFPGKVPSGKGLTILFVGRLERRKGIDVLLEVIPGMLREYPDLSFTIAGDDSIPIVPGESDTTYRVEFERQHAGEPFLDRVKFTGRLPEAELYRRYAGCDIFVAPSRYESFGLIFLEAMMFGKPVVGCRAGGMVEIIEEDGNGFMAKPGDRDTLRQALKRLVEDEPLRNRFGERSRNLFEERFSDERMVDGVLAYYREILARKPGTTTTSAIS